MKNIDLFISCLIDQFYPQVGWDVVKVLEKLDCQVSFNPNQTCCGMPAYYKGHKEGAKEVATKFIEDFNSNNPIVAPSAACVNMVKNSYDHFFKNTSNHNIYRALQERIFEFSDFLMNQLKVESLPTEFHHKVAYHYNCHAVNGLHNPDDSIALLNMVKGLELVHSDKPGFCCGYSGDFASNYEKEAVERANRLLDSFEASGAEVVVSNDYHCLFHFSAIIKKSDRPVKLMHLAEVLAQGW